MNESSWGDEMRNEAQKYSMCRTSLTLNMKMKLLKQKSLRSKIDFELREKLYMSFKKELRLHQNTKNNNKRPKKKKQR